MSTITDLENFLTPMDEAEPTTTRAALNACSTSSADAMDIGPSALGPYSTTPTDAVDIKPATLNAPAIPAAKPVQVRILPLTNTASFATFCSRYNDWASATQSSPHFLTFLSLIQVDSLYNKLRQIKIPTGLEYNHKAYTDHYMKHLGSTAQTTNQHKLLTLQQLPSETVEKYAERVENIMYKCTNDRFTNKTLGYNAFINGILDKAMKQKLYESEISDFTLLVERAIRLESAKHIADAAEPLVEHGITFATSSQYSPPVASNNPQVQVQQHGTSGHKNEQMSRPPFTPQYQQHGQGYNRNTFNRPQGRVNTNRTCYNCGRGNHLVHSCTLPLDFNKIPQNFWRSLQRGNTQHTNNGLQFFRAPQTSYQPRYQTQHQPQHQPQFQPNQGQQFIPNSAPVFRGPGPQ